MSTSGAIGAELGLEPFELVLKALRAAGRSVRLVKRGDAARAQCPAHKDRKPSLSVTRGDGTVLICCHAGCPTALVLTALDLTWRQLFSRDHSNVARPARIVATYEYRAFDNDLIAEKVRREPKQFVWRRRNVLRPSGYESGTGDAELPLYHLPHLTDRTTILVAEGEKAVDRLRALGFAATCPPAGASAWQTRWTDQLWRAGACDVIILADADEAGRRHAERVAKACHGYRSPVDWIAHAALWPTEPDETVLRVKVLDLPGLPASGDVVDWLDAGGTAIELRQLIDAKDDWSPDWREQERVSRKRALNAERQRRYRKRHRDRNA